MTHSNHQLSPDDRHLQPADHHPLSEGPEHRTHPPHHHHPPPPPPPPHHHHAEHHRHERHEYDVLIRAMQMWNEKTNDRPSVDDLIAMAEREGAKGPAAILRSYNSSIDDIYLVIDRLDIDLAVKASHRRRELHEFAIDKRVGLLVPVPPYIHDAFGHDPATVTLIPDHEELPPHLRRISADRLVRGSRLCRSRLNSLQIIVLEVFRNSRISAAAAVADLLDERILAPDARIIAHIRPHLRHDDETLRDAIVDRIEAY